MRGAAERPPLFSTAGDSVGVAGYPLHGETLASLRDTAPKDLTENVEVVRRGLEAAPEVLAFIEEVLKRR